MLAVRLNGDGEREPGVLRWGLIPHFADPDSYDRLLINARGETVAEAPSFRDAFRTHRCLIVADGFYEWRAEETGKKPVWITRPSREPFAFAGIWAEARRADGSSVHSCAIVTCEPGEILGWSAVVAPFRATVDAVATEPTRIVAFDAPALRARLVDDHELAAELLPLVLESVSGRLTASWQQLLDMFGSRTEPW